MRFLPLGENRLFGRQPKCYAQIVTTQIVKRGIFAKDVDKLYQKDNVAWIIEEERRYVTVLFSDLTRYSKLFEHRDPEKVKELTQTIFGEVSLIVSKYHGFIEQVIGDEVMVLFGVPKTREDDFARAVRAAMEIHAAPARLLTATPKDISFSNC
jgi:class 3 adenylate cyclase